MSNKILSARSIRRIAAKRTRLALCRIPDDSTDSDLEDDADTDVTINVDMADVSVAASDTTSLHSYHSYGDFQLEPLSSTSNESDSSSVEDDTTEDQPVFQDQLRAWVAESGTPLKHTNSLLALLRPHFPSLPKDGRTLLKTCKKYDISDVAGGKYHHFGVAAGVKLRLEKCKDIRHFSELNLQFNIDGLPLFKSSSDSFWPILALIHQETDPEPFICGLWVGKSKPNSIEEYLSSFVSELLQIQRNGIESHGNMYTVKILNFVCDTPARAFVKNIKGHSGYYGCDFCVQKGLYVNHRMTFPEKEASQRTDDKFDRMLYEEHHRGDTPLRSLDLGLVSQFPLDYMHSVCLGVTKKLLSLWMSGPLDIRVGNHVVREVSESIVNLSKFLPREFLRKGRSMYEVDRWKATEFRTFLLYTGPVVLQGKLPSNLYHNFVIFSAAISILSSKTFCPLYNEYAKTLLCEFVQHFGTVYGPENIVYNVHSLTHLSSHCLLFGPLHCFSGFPFENHLQTIKKLVRKPKYPLPQVIRRLSEKMNISTKKHTGTFCSAEHNQGPLPDDDFRSAVQYKRLYASSYTLTITEPDNAVLIRDATYVVINILIHQEKQKIVCRKFKTKESLYTYPFNSEKIHISVVSSLEKHLSVFNADEVSAKVVLLPLNHKFVSIPLIESV